MPRYLLGIFIMLHGLVHLWYVVLSQRPVRRKPKMDWTGRSWILSPLFGDAATRSLATALHVVVTIGFVAGGIGMCIQQEWWRPAVAGSAASSTAIIVLFWDGGMQMLEEKGLVGLLIDIMILAALLFRGAPA